MGYSHPFFKVLSKETFEKLGVLKTPASHFRQLCLLNKLNLKTYF